MRVRFRLLAVLAALLPLAACVPGLSGSFGPGPVPDAGWTAASDPDSIATWALRGCRWGSLGARRTCVERALGSLIGPAGIGKAMAALDRVAARDGGMLRESHGLAHGLGIAAYRSPETVAETFAACPPTQISGCYHGVVQGYFLDVARRRGDVGAAEMNALCAPHRESGLLYFQCTHGMGHGVMAMLANHVPASLEKCDLVEEDGARDSCYGGVFMENIVAATHPEHTAHSHAEVSAGGGGAEGGHAGHGDHGGEAARAGHGGHAERGAGHPAPRQAWKPLDARDPLYPCTAVAERYQYQCYLIHASAMLFATRGDFARTAKDCAAAPARFVSVCWRSLGRDITAFAARRPAKTARLCGKTGAAAGPDCVRGAAETLVNTASDPADGFALCRVVAGEANKTACYQGVGRTLPGLVPDRARREALCAAIEAGHAEPCRRAADLLPRDEQAEAGS